MTRAFTAIALVAALSVPVQAQTVGAPYKDAEAFMYSMTGLFGQVGRFSSGVFKVTDDAVKDYPTLRAYKRAHYQKAAVYATAKANYLATGEPIVLLGHSLGANAVWWIARRLKADGIPVAAAFSYDQTKITAPCVPDNVIAAIGFTRGYADLFGGGAPRLCDGNTKTALENHVIAGGHTYVDDDPAVHRLTRKHIGEVVHMIREMKGAQ